MSCTCCDPAIATLVSVNDQPQRIVDTLEVWEVLDDDLVTVPVLIICVESKGTAPLEEPLTEHQAEQP